MRSMFQISTVIFIVLCIFKREVGYGQSSQDSALDSAFVIWAKAHAVGIDTNDLSTLKPVVGKAKIVALGEPAHGLHEMLSFRNAMFKYLVEKKGFTAIVLEADFAKARIVNDFVNGGESNVLGVAQALTIGKPLTENVELISWIRQYNQQGSTKRKIRFYGMDMQMAGFPGDTTPSHPAVDAVLEYLRKVDLVTAKRFESELGPFLPQLSVTNYVKLSPIKNERLSNVLDELITVLMKYRSVYTKVSTRREYEWNLHAAVVARQTHRLIQLLPPEGQFNVSPDAWLAASCRDSSMAENVRWIADKEEKIFIYSHNGHIKNAPTIGGNWDLFAKAPMSTGQFLRKFYTNKLVILGISLPSPHYKAQITSLDTALSKIGRSRFLLDLKPVAANLQAAKWLEVLRPMQANMVSFFNLRVNTAFDAIVYFDKASSAIIAE